MNLYADKIQAMSTAFDLTFKEAFTAAPGVCDAFCMTVGDADHTLVELPFFDTFGFMRKWVGPRQIKNLAARKLVMREQAYEDTLAIPQRQIETDNWGFYRAAIAQMGENARLLWDRLALDALTNPGSWIDNKAFFATDRKYGKSTICNKTTSALSAGTFDTAYQTICGYCAHDGEPLGVAPDTLMIGPKLRKTAFEILHSRLTLNGGTAAVDNPDFGICRTIINPRLVGDYDDYWFLMSCNGAIKPVALQKSKEGTLAILNRPTDEAVFMEGNALFGADAYGSAAAAFPHLVYAGIL